MTLPITVVGSTSTAGTGSLSVIFTGGAGSLSTSFKLYSRIPYSLQNGADWEWGLGTCLPGNVLARTQVNSKRVSGVLTEGGTSAISLSGTTRVVLQVTETNWDGFAQETNLAAELAQIYKGRLGRVELGNIGRRIIDGRMGTFDNSTTKTFLAAFEVPFDFDAARLILVNANTSTYTVASCCFVSIDTTSNLSGVGLAWTNGAFDGATGTTVPAAASSVRRSYKKSDWCQFTSQGRLKIIAVRVEITTAATINVMGNGSDDYTPWATRTDGKIACFRNQAGSFATSATASGFSSTTNVSQSPIIGVEVSLRGRILNVGVLGDSTDEGRGTYKGDGWAGPTCAALEAETGVPVMLSNLSWASQSMGHVYNHALDMITYAMAPDVLFIPGGSINDLTPPINSSMIKTCRTNLAATLAQFYGMTKPPHLIIRNIEPCNPAVKNFDASDSIRTNYNAELMTATYGASGFALFDFSTPLSGVTDGDGQVNMLVGATDDNIHPNDTGNALCVPSALSALKAAIGL